MSEGRSQTLTVITPTYAPDREQFLEAHAAVLRHTPANTQHVIVVPDRDRDLFAGLAGPRCSVTPERSLLPTSFRRIPSSRWTVNTRRPWPPVRGWVLQQLIKLAAVSAVDSDMALLVDSDVLLVRAVTAADLLRDGSVRLYRQPGAIDGRRLPRHLLWHRAAERLLGVPPAEPPLDDYVSSFNVWEPALVRSMLARIEEVTQRRWQDALASELHLSEFTLYGVFVRRVVGRPSTTLTDDSLCHCYWDPVPLDASGARAFVAAMPRGSAAVMISAKSRTPTAVRREALRHLMADTWAPPASS